MLASDEIELPKFNSDDNDIRNHNEENNGEEEGKNNNKKIIIAIIVIIGVLILGVIIFLIIYFSSKRKENGGYIKVIHEIDEENEIKILNVDNLESDDYLIEEVKLDDTISIRNLDENDYDIDKNILKFNYNVKRDGRIEFKIKFNKKLTRIDGLFQKLNIIEADFSEFKSDKIKNMNSLFLDCYKLENINFNNFNSEKVESMDNTFENCRELNELDLSSFRTPKLISMKSTFRNCPNLEYLNLENFDLNSNIIERENIFDGDDNLYIKSNNEKTKALLDSENRNSNNTVYTKNCEVGKNQCSKCDSTNQCESCYKGYYLKYLTNTNLCKKCYKGCSSCSNYMYCDECQSGYYLNDELHKCLQNIESTDSGITDINSLILDYSSIPSEEPRPEDSETEYIDTESPSSDRFR